MAKKRVFTKKELKDMGTRTLDLVKKAIDAGDKKKAKELAERMYNEFQFLHDGYMFWITGLQTHIYKKYGVDALEAAEREAHTIEARAIMKPPKKTDFRSRVEGLASGLRGHLQNLEIVEDDEKVSLTMKPCGSGERIMLMGGYNPEIGLARIKEPHRITWGMKDFPIYCVHSPVMEALSIENFGNFGSCHCVSDPMFEESCQFVLYKDPADIPEKMYTRIGKKKPAKK